MPIKRPSDVPPAEITPHEFYTRWRVSKNVADPRSLRPEIGLSKCGRPREPRTSYPLGPPHARRRQRAARPVQTADVPKNSLTFQ